MVEMNREGIVGNREGIVGNNVHGMKSRINL